MCKILQCSAFWSVNGAQCRPQCVLKHFDNGKVVPVRSTPNNPEMACVLHLVKSTRSDIDARQLTLTMKRGRTVSTDGVNFVKFRDVERLSAAEKNPEFPGNVIGIVSRYSSAPPSPPSLRGRTSF